jgi:probable HAF family extracellular repeat protein
MRRLLRPYPGPSQGPDPFAMSSRRRGLRFFSSSWVAAAVVAAALAGLGSCFDERPAAEATLAEPTVTEVRGACTPGLAPPAGGYARIVEIGSLGGNRVFVEDVNDDGVAVGGQTTADGSFHAFRHTDLGGVEDLGAHAGLGLQSFASAIAPNGAIGGHADRGDGTGVLFGFGYTPVGGRTAVCPGGCSVWDLNGRGQLAGLFPGRDPTTWQAFVFSPGAGVTLLGTLGGARSSASAISEAGVVVGNAQPSGVEPGDIGHAFMVDLGVRAAAGKPVMRDLNAVVRAPGWVLQAATDVNDRFIVGYGTRGNEQRAFRVQLDSGAVVDLGTPQDGHHASAWAVDSFGDVVGWAQTGQGGLDGGDTAFVYATGLGGMRRLADLVDPALGWTLSQASGLNGRGSIVGWGIHAGAIRGFKLTFPICLNPEP